MTYSDIVMGTGGQTSPLSVLPSDYWAPNGTTTVPNIGLTGTKALTYPSNTVPDPKSLTFDSLGVSNSPSGSYLQTNGGETVFGPQDPSNRNKIAFACWIESTASSDQLLTARAIMTLHNGNQRGYVFGMFPGGGLIASSFNNDRGRNSAATGPAILPGVRYHVGFVLNEDTNDIRLYVDGQRVATGLFEATSTIQDGGDLFLGRGQTVRIGTPTIQSQVLALSGLYAYTAHLMMWRGSQMPTDADFSALYAEGVGLSASTLTLDGLIPNSEVRVYAAGTQTEVAGIESSSSSESFSISSSLVDIVIHKEDYEYIRLTGINSSSDVSIPVQQRFDRNYVNP